MDIKYSITFGGDTSLGDYYVSKSENKSLLLRLVNDPASFVEGLKPIIENSTHLILNLETVLAENPPILFEGKKWPNYDNPNRTLKVLKGSGVTAVNLANNHSKDFGSEIMLNTIQQLNDVGINSFGAGANIHEASKPLRIQLKGRETTKTIYILASLLASKRFWKEFSFCADQEKPGVNPFKINSLKKRITNLRSKDPNAIIIVCPHWQGYDYKWVSPKTKDICREIIDAGANYVLAHGTHMVNPLETRGKGIIAYSIGNFIFNSLGRYQKFNAPPYSFIVRLEIEENNGKWGIEERFYPIVSDNRRTEYNSRPVDESEAEEIQQILSEKSNTQHQNPFSIKKDSRGFYFAFDREQHRETSTNTNVINLDYEVFKPLIGRTPNTYKVKWFSSRKLISQEFAKLGYKSTVIDKYLIVDAGNRKLCFLSTESSNTSLIGYRILKNKHDASEFLSRAGVSVAKGKLFKNYQKEEAKEFALSLKTCVVKPVDGRKGIGISVGVSNKKEFETAWDNAIAVTNKGILVEEQFIGIEARYLVVGNKCVAVAQRIPPHVIGNGTDTVERLIQKKNDTRKKNPHLKSRLIKLNQHRMSIIQNQGLELDSIPLKDEIVLIDWKASFSKGGDSYDITEEVHPLFKEIAERVSLMIPGLDIIGVDIIAKDHIKEPNNSNYIIVEANTRPSIGGHQYPAYGKPRNVARLIVEHSLSSIDK